MTRTERYFAIQSAGLCEKIVPLFLALLLAGISGCMENSSQNERSDSADHRAPNIIYILADDLGYGELGVYGQEKIETPHIDGLASAGMKFTQHYSGSAVCAPSRYMLMTGKHPGNAYIRGNDELPQRGDIGSFAEMLENPSLEGQRPIPSNTVTLGELLQSVGYTTAAIGKWGLGGPCSSGHPNEQGFDFFYGYLCQRQAHTYFPTHLWKNKERVYLDNDLVPPHQSLPEEAAPYDPVSYKPYHEQPDYAAELMHSETIKFIDKQGESPFFLYLPTPIPHVSLQAPQRWIDYYVNKFGEEEPYPGGSYVPVRYPNATYAAMISYLDEQVGEIVEKLKAKDLYENTLIIFTSDNGPTFTGGVDPEYFDSAAPFKSTYGWGKGFLREGGIRVPMIAAWKRYIPEGSVSEHLSAFWDVLPTLSEITGFQLPDDSDGISFLPVLKGLDEDQKKHEYLYWEFPGYGGQQAVRMGRWKAVRLNLKENPNAPVELYNLDVDLREQNNVANQFPEIVKEMELIMKREHTPSELFPLLPE